MTITEFRQLKKLMMLAAGSTSDNETISAFRFATAILTQNGFTWERALDRVITVIDAVESDPEEMRNR